MYRISHIYVFILILSSGVGLGLKWTNLNPLNLMKNIKLKGENVANFPFDMLETYMKRVSVSIKNIYCNLKLFYN